MLSRKEQNSSGNPLPEIWKNEVLNLLNSIYSAQLKERNYFFEIHGFSYPDELFLAASTINNNNRSISPASVCLSTDLRPKQDIKKTLDIMMDSLGILLDNYFKQTDSENWPINWQEESFKKTIVHYKITREDISLTIEADKLLKSCNQ